MDMTKFLLDSGDPDEYKTISVLAKHHDSQIWGSTTNPSLIAKKLAGRKVSQKEAFQLQKQIVLEIVEFVPGAVSAEVYADQQTSSEQMIEQGREIATWHERVVVKLPTTFEGLKARTPLRRGGICVNNTLVFSIEQIFAICLHEKLIQEEDGPIKPSKSANWPPFISPFVGRLDDIGQDGMDLVENGMKIKEMVGANLWMLEASVRKLEHIKRGQDANVEIITAPGKVLQEWFLQTEKEKEDLDSQSYSRQLSKKPQFEPAKELLEISTLPELMDAIESGVIDINHELTDKGLVRFADDWKEILL